MNNMKREPSKQGLGQQVVSDKLEPSYTKTASQRMNATDHNTSLRSFEIAKNSMRATKQMRSAQKKNMQAKAHLIKNASQANDVRAAGFSGFDLYVDQSKTSQNFQDLDFKQKAQ